MTHPVVTVVKQDIEMNNTSLEEEEQDKPSLMEEEQDKISLMEEEQDKTSLMEEEQDKTPEIETLRIFVYTGTEDIVCMMMVTASMHMITLLTVSIKTE